ncbi:hypothetical protein DS745_09965 [Anaerobacillus alkaliphilus]|uniref:SCP2 domain-containing protein n=1 Tax=Anaerobacillus alkaliphilus TaxID=1548597 RepID=A0A4Q0VUC5_9BACI|nr:hypothetical protein [Anaerobacillus alkaliphilus]RXJ01791.1 hypothetical protein DS745_09965 [Anaerobacillus alkaliphilus]
MKQVLEFFQRRYKDSHHLHTLFKERPFTIVFEVETELYPVTIQAETIQLLRHTSEDVKIDVFIQGKEGALRKLLQGEERLQYLKKLDEITVQGTYTSVLKAETFLYLNCTSSS